MNINDRICQANLRGNFLIWRGECLSIGKAISDVFGGDIVFVTKTPYEGFDHTVVEIDNKLYDGSGRIGWGETVDRFIDKEHIQEDIDNHFYSPENPIEKYSSGFEYSTYASAKNKLLRTAPDNS